MKSAGATFVSNFKTEKMEQKVVIITGANSGIGKAAAQQFANEGHTVIMACRNISTSSKVQKEIIQTSKNEKVFLKAVDMSSFASIHAFCDDFMNRFSKLDILIHNAAYCSHGEKYRLSDDGIELTFATNVAGPFLMTNLLLKHLANSEDPRVLNVSSNIIKHFFSPEKEIDFDNLQGVSDSKYRHSVYKSYRNSKMALLMLTFRMAEEYEGLGIKVNSLQVNGARMSDATLKKFTPKWRMIARLQNLFFRQPEFFADHYYEISTSDKYKSTSGKHFNHRQEIMEPLVMNPKLKDILGTSVYPAYAEKRDVRDQIWRLCNKLCAAYLPAASNGWPVSKTAGMFASS
jgi:NAD(P)-dependent dehydrogenase (short-subunit alcohol dehydrogenase family)